MRILFLSPNQSGRWNRGHQLFRDAVAAQHETLFVGPGYDDIGELQPPYDVPEILEVIGDLNFDVVMTYGLKYSYQYHSLDKVKIPKVHFGELDPQGSRLYFLPISECKNRGCLH